MKGEREREREEIEWEGEEKKKKGKRICMDHLASLNDTILTITIYISAFVWYEKAGFKLHF